jgi:hypothetical protein
MGVDLIGIGLSYNWRGWHALYDLGVAFGWRPAGTLKPKEPVTYLNSYPPLPIAIGTGKEIVARAIGADALMPNDWRDAWDWAVASAYLNRIDDKDRLRCLAEERVRLDAELHKKFEQLVRERSYYELGRSMSGPIKASLMMFATAVRRAGKGTSKSAARFRRDAQLAMAQCYGAIPCWIMPSWRVAEQLPGEVGTFDLVIMDEASQSDIRELPVLLTTCDASASSRESAGAFGVVGPPASRSTRTAAWPTCSRRSTA